LTGGVLEQKIGDSLSTWNLKVVEITSYLLDRAELPDVKDTRSR
jgi:hypothetical protein